jgi:excisionase family DNA binding protein
MHDDAAMVTTAQAARALGVGVSSVKRWVDDGVLPAYKTAGGHRKLCLADVLRLAREKEFPHLDLKQLPLALPTAAPPRDVDAATSLYHHLLAGDADAAEGIVRAAYFGGQALGAVADSVVRPAMAQIGLDWQNGRIDVMHEHRATHICAQAIVGIKQLLERRRTLGETPGAVGGSPEGHWHTLANLLAEVVLVEAGWNVVNLGPNTPIASFRKAIKELRPRLIWLSVNPLTESDRFLTDYVPLFDDARHADVAVAIGGQGLTEEIRSRLPYTTFGDGLAHLAAFARSLHPIPKPRARGRPPRRRPG